MSRLKLDPEIFGLTSFWERLTGVPVKDCFQQEEMLYVVVPPGMMGKIIGKEGVIIRQAQFQLKKTIRVVEFSENLGVFVQNFLAPLQVESVTIQGDTVLLQDPRRRIKGQLLGRGGKQLQVLQRAVQRFFPGKEVKVV